MGLKIFTQSLVDLIYQEFTCLLNNASKEAQEFQDTIKPIFLHKQKTNKQETLKIKSLKREIRKAYGVYKTNPSI